jgi:hypothetical protein
MNPDATSDGKLNHAAILSHAVEDLTVLSAHPQAMLSNLKLFGTLAAVERVGEWLWAHREDLKACLAFLRALAAEITAAQTSPDPNAAAPPAA